MNSHRAKAYGHLSWLRFLQRYTEYFGISKVTCLIQNYCDNLGIINISHPKTWWDTGRTVLHPDYDVINEIRITQEDLQEQFPKLKPGVHVKGHQDKTVAYHDLSRPAQLNVIADRAATKALNLARQNKDPPEYYFMPNCTAYLISGNAVILSQERYLERVPTTELLHEEIQMVHLNSALNQLANLPTLQEIHVIR